MPRKPASPFAAPRADPMDPPRESLPYEVYVADTPRSAFRRVLGGNARPQSFPTMRLACRCAERWLLRFGKNGLGFARVWDRETDHVVFEAHRTAGGHIQPGVILETDDGWRLR